MISPRERLVLLSVHRDQAELAARSPVRVDGTFRRRVQLARQQIQIDRAHEGWTPVRLAAWLMRPPTPSDFVQFHRVYHRLERKGLVELPEGKATAIRLTDAGEAEVRRLVKEPIQ
jgi:hypothetical protein